MARTVFETGNAAAPWSADDTTYGSGGTRTAQGADVTAAVYVMQICLPRSSEHIASARVRCSQVPGCSEKGSPSPPP
jgi:hypothetical protein